MSNNFFSQDDEEDFRDVPEEVAGGQAEVPNVRTTRPPVPQQTQQQIVAADAAYDNSPQNQMEAHEQSDDDEEDFSSVLNDARFRLEQGRLYELIMNNNIFEGAEGDEKAVKYVMKQVRNFAKEQMEIMLGMRQEKQGERALSASDFPFNDLEVQTLKALASAATKGATASPAAQSFSGIQAATPKQTAFKPIGMTPKSTPIQQKQVSKPVQKPLAQKPASPVTRNARTEVQIEQILREENITREEYDRQYNPNYKPLTKPLHNMNETEIAEWRRQEALRTNKQVKNPQAIPMPTAEQEEMLHTQRANAASSHPQMQSIMTLLLNQKKTTQEVNMLELRNSLNRSFASIVQGKKLYGKLRKSSVVAISEFKDETTITLSSGTKFTVNQTTKQVSKILGI